MDLNDIPADTCTPCLVADLPRFRSPYSAEFEGECVRARYKCFTHDREWSTWWSVAYLGLREPVGGSENVASIIDRVLDQLADQCGLDRLSAAADDGAGAAGSRAA